MSNFKENRDKARKNYFTKQRYVEWFERYHFELVNSTDDLIYMKRTVYYHDNDIEQKLKIDIKNKDIDYDDSGFKFDEDDFLENFEW